MDYRSDTLARVLYWRRNHGREASLSMLNHMGVSEMALRIDRATGQGALNVGGEGGGGEGGGGEGAARVEWSLKRGLSALAPNDYICPISLSVMSDPVKVQQSGISYEVRALVSIPRPLSHRPPCLQRRLPPKIKLRTSGASLVRALPLRR